ncbi:hypothetical protein Ga0102493_112271 [Erythrobacter litoralis]|uniref:Lipoprotein n=1 Tax=Erythrobacter litoralis TaxID=39960 RepID=A0A074MGJ4_9SPHN|nr:DUF5818 domain-containing protein [Erythrobacter litoralis]AOL23286.1 hypothetical protein Ga0102493_112271 [Erythrobacter litoralis]KEO92569.1 hypothetical protein EH32_15015 [Erythrobacter litoralis]
MRPNPAALASALFAIGVTGCDTAPSEQSVEPSPSPVEAEMITVEERIMEGTECPVLVTPDGARYALALGEADFGPGDYVRFTGPRAQASVCMEGEATLTPDYIESIDPPARDRDPARAGGIALDVAYVTGAWAAKGVDATCDRPDFEISESPGAIVIETRVNGTPETARVVLGDYPRIDWDDPLPDTPIEARGPDGLAVLRPATDAAYDSMEIAGHRIAGDGAVFVKCAG